tara:strand:- start:226 stop:573 length:348 start_codon:yes stop_codon:yes gene_type:complete
MRIKDLVASDTGIDIIKEDTKTLSQGFTSIGKSNQVVGSILNAKIGEILGPLETNRGHALIEVVNVSQFDSTEYRVQKDLIKNSLFTKRQNQYFQAWLDDLKSEANIIDNRSFYF